jgi:hypothetical protein
VSVAIQMKRVFPAVACFLLGTLASGPILAGTQLLLAGPQEQFILARDVHFRVAVDGGSECGSLTREGGGLLSGTPVSVRRQGPVAVVDFRLVVFDPSRQLSCAGSSCGPLAPGCIEVGQSSDSSK